MALYRVAIVKEATDAPYEGEQWRNVYTVEAASYEAALAVGDLIAIQEMLFHTNRLTAIRVTAHGLFEPARRTGAQLGINRGGGYAGVGDAWPLFVCLRVDYANVGVGRPERKYYRVGPTDGMVESGGLWLGTYQTPTVQDAIDNIASLTNYVGPSGEAHTTATIVQRVANRQLGWHRRSRPGFRRGYVAV